MASVCMDLQPPTLVVHEEKVHTHEYANSRDNITRNNINLYLQLLKEELDTLWDELGVTTWDASGR